MLLSMLNAMHLQTRSASTASCHYVFSLLMIIMTFIDRQANNSIWCLFIISLRRATIVHCSTMGVAWVFEYKSSTSSSIGPQLLKDIEKSVEANGGVRDGNYRVDSLPYRPNVNVASGISLIYLLHHSEYPLSTFTIAPGEARDKTSARAVSDRGFDLILAKLESGLMPDNPGLFECAGGCFVLGDFVLRIGNASMAATFKATIVEVEYRPLSIATQCHKLMLEFVRSTFPSCSAEIPIHLARMNENEQYYPIDTVQQYLDLFLDLRRRTQLTTMSGGYQQMS